MAFILGLLQSTLGFTAFDAASHMVEEMPNPSRNAPLVMCVDPLLIEDFIADNLVQDPRCCHGCCHLVDLHGGPPLLPRRL